MAKIDVSKIDGYADMTAEQKLAALEAYEFEDKASADGSEVAKLKTALSKASSDAADWKHKYQNTLSEAEKAEAERAEREKATQDELNTLRRDKTVSAYTAKYLAMGYDADLALASAVAYADGDTDTVFKNQAIFNENYKKSIETTAVNRQPSLSTGSVPTPDKEAEQMNELRRYAGLI